MVRLPFENDVAVDENIAVVGQEHGVDGGVNI